MTKKRRRPGSGSTRPASAPEVRALAAPATPLAAHPSLAPALGRITPRPSLWGYNPAHQYAELSFPQVVGILRAAERGYTEQWVDLTERMRTDDHLYSVLETRIASVAGAKWKLNPGRSDNPIAQQYAERAAEDCERMLRSIPNLQRMFRDMLDAVPVGWSVLEIIWEPRGGEVEPAEVVWIHPRRFRFADDFSLYLWDDGLAAGVARERDLPLASDRGASGMALTPNKYIIHIPRVVQSYPQTSGLLTACVRAWWEKLWVTKFWIQGAEVAGNPRYWATVPQAAPDNVFEHLQEGLEALAADGVAAFREGVSVNVSAPLAQGSGSVWETRFNACNAAMSKAILGSTLNVEIGDTGGAYAAAESQGDVTISPRIASDAAAMWETIKRDLLRPYLWFNRHRYGGEMPPLPTGESIFYESQPEFSDALIRTKSITRNELRQAFKLPPLSQGGDEFVVDETAAPAFPFSDDAVGGAAATAIDAATEEAPAGLPLSSTTRPWETAVRLALSMATRDGSDATQTSTRSPTT